MSIKEEIHIIFDNIRNEIDNRLIEFKRVFSSKDENILFNELVFCLLTPQSKARNAAKTIEIILTNGKLYNANAESLADDLNYVRFKNNKAKYIVEARNKFILDGLSLYDILNSEKDIIGKREWLVSNIKGYGFKEASHFLRNIGFYEEIAILDRHILKNLEIYNVIEEIPKSLTKDKYHAIERKMAKFAEEIEIPLEYLDYVLWYKETNDIFK